MRAVAVLASATLLLISASGVADGRAHKCKNYEPLRQPFFGDLHVHTSYSIDAFVFDTVNRPSDAYSFAKGEGVGLTPLDIDKKPKRMWQLRLPLDFTAVTDHAEGFGITNVCTTKKQPGTLQELAYDSPECQLFRGVIPSPDVPVDFQTQETLHERIGRATLLIQIASVGVVPPNPGATCTLFSDQCDQGAASIWQDTQDAANDNYDQTDACRFTTFVAYEWTAMPGAANLHRNVIFRNENVPATPTSYFDTKPDDSPFAVPDVRILWQKLDDTCLKKPHGKNEPACDVLTIPHNSNLSAGLMFLDPLTATEAENRAIWEPLVEITQHKGASECRFDKTYGAGVDTTDEQCSFEQMPALTLFPIPGPSNPPPPQAFPRRSFVRNVLKDGLALEQRGFVDTEQPGRIVHVNPFRLGIIGSTDDHNGTPGNTDEIDWPGHGANADDSAMKRMTDGGLARANPGGLAVVWAEENSRDSIFDALRRKETYGTSGTRPIVRFFGGWNYDDDLCSQKDLVQTGYEQGVPMGRDLPAPRPEGALPKFVVQAMKSADEPGVPAITSSDGVYRTPARPPVPGTPLQRIQIVKGWVDALGQPYEKVFNVEPRNTDGSLREDSLFDRSVNSDCSPVATGSPELCTVWSDPEFNATEPAFYYVRILEDPTCRWSTYNCQELGIDPLTYGPSDTAKCLTDAVTVKPGTNLTDCCPSRIDPVVQERAWTSPIWYKPAS